MADSSPWKRTKWRRPYFALSLGVSWLRDGKTHTVWGGEGGAGGLLFIGRPVRKGKERLDWVSDNTSHALSLQP